MTGLAARDLHARLGRRDVVKAVSFCCESGHVIGLVGRNGAGKTSLLRAVAGLLPMVAGDVVLDGHFLTSKARGRLVAYLPQERTVSWPLAVRDVVMLGRLPHRRPVAAPSHDDHAIVERVMTELDIADLAQRPVTQLSGGERARVLIARALAQMPRLLLADEPTSGLDPAHQIEVMELFRSTAHQGRIVVVALHDLSQITRWCDRVLVLDEGRLIANGRPEDALDAERLEHVFAIEAAHIRHAGKLVIMPTRSLRSGQSGYREGIDDGM